MDISPAVVTKLAERGSSVKLGIVTDVGLFVHQPQPPPRTDTVDIDLVEHALEDLDMLTPLPAAGSRI